MPPFEDRIVSLFREIHPLDQIARAGFVLRGVASPESVAAHSHFVALMTLLFVDAYPDAFDGPKAVAMALIHDLPEARLMDIPMPVADAYLREAKEKAEQSIFEAMFSGFPDRFADWSAELHEAKTPEARLVRGLDKAQMMLKVHLYEQEGRGRLAEFWENPANFRDYGLPQVSALFNAICALAGKPRPV